jgi:hypothetical protein
VWGVTLFGIFDFNAALLTILDIVAVSRCHLPLFPVTGSLNSFVEGKTNCQITSLPIFLYFLPNLSGKKTFPKPFFISSECS